MQIWKTSHVHKEPYIIADIVVVNVQDARTRMNVECVVFLPCFVIVHIGMITMQLIIYECVKKT